MVSQGTLENPAYLSLILLRLRCSVAECLDLGVPPLMSPFFASTLCVASPEYDKEFPYY